MKRSIFTLFAMSAAAQFALATGLPTDGLQVHFRFDHTDLMEVDASGKAVAGWETEPGVGTHLTLVKNGAVACPLLQENAFTRADGTGCPALRFRRNANNDADVGNTQLVSSQKTTLNLGQESTWFLVMNNLTANKQKALFSLHTNNSGNKFGGFFINDDGNKLRMHNSVAGNNTTIASIPDGQACIIDSRGSSGRMTGGLNGSEVFNAAVSIVPSRSAESFYLGKWVSDMESAAFDCAELAIYNRALNDAERRIVRNALAARWGLTIADPLWSGAGDGFCDDLAGVGFETATGDGRIPGVVVESSSSGGLVVSVPQNSLSGENGYLLVAHDGTPSKVTWSEEDGCLRVMRTWRTESTLAASPVVTFTFDIGELVAGADSVDGRLLYRASSSGEFADTGLTGVSSGGSIAFTFPAGSCRDGEYALAISSIAESAKSIPPSSGMTVWFKPDVGLQTDQSGVVTKWVNQGSIGSAADVLAYSGLVMRVENALHNASGTTDYPALDFGGNSFLKTAAKTDVGRSAVNPPSWFVVFKPGDDATAQKDSGLFGFSVHDDKKRFGAFFPKASGGYALRGFVGGSPYLDGSAAAGSWHVAGMTAYWQSRSILRPCLAMDASDSSADIGNPDYMYCNASSYFKVGHIMGDKSDNGADDWGKPFSGRIAEIRVYKKTLDPVEMLFVEQELADKYDLALSNPYLSVAHASGSAYNFGLTAVGYGCEDFAVPASSSPACGGLVVDCPGWTGSTSSSTIWIGHNVQPLSWTTSDGTITLGRSWYVKGGATLQALRLNFALGNATNGGKYVLCYRTSDTDAWTRLRYPANVAYGSVSVEVPAGLLSGYFTLGKIHGLSIILR